MQELADNLRRLRKAAHLTQADLGERADLPRATVAAMEKPDANPGLAAVVAVAKALGVSMDELTAPPPRHRYYKVTADAAVPYRDDANRFISTLISPIASRGVQIQRVVLKAGCRAVGRPHPRDSQEFFLCLAGTAHLVIDGDEVSVEPGCLVQFPGHVNHHYLNRSQSEDVEAVSVVALAV